ncbi:MAG TPA: hypothetical protein VN963_10635 [bacterium]|nr:hypothetical protein [bacterium]
MKEIIFAFVFTLFAMPVLADNLQPVSSGQAIQEWQAFWESNSIDPGNHVVWKLYVFRAMPDREDPKGELQYVLAGLTPFPRSSYYVRIRIDLLYNYFKPVPKRGDVIVVSGRVTTRQDYLLDLTSTEVPIKLLTMQLDGAAKLPEQFDPAATPRDRTRAMVPSTPTPIATPPTPAPSPAL